VPYFFITNIPRFSMTAFAAKSGRTALPAIRRYR
jgi:hypothetical protein